MTWDWVANSGSLSFRSPSPRDQRQDAVMADASFSGLARELYAIMLVRPGSPLDPYVMADGDPFEIAAAVDELLRAGLAVRMPRPRRTLPHTARRRPGPL